MEGKELLRALLDQAGLNPNSLADKLDSRSLQSQVQRFLDGRTRNPRWSTLEPVANYFRVGVDAFFDPDAAQAVAIARGLLNEGTMVVREAAHSWDSAVAPLPIRSKKHPALYDLLVQIAGQFEPYDMSARKAVASLLGDLALTPETASITAQRIERLLDVPGNEGQQKSTASPPASRK